MVPATDTESNRWVSASELAEHAYCPRAWWYATNGGGPARDAVQGDSLRAGQHAHAARLGAVETRDRWAGVARVAAAASAILLGLAVGLLLLGR